MHTQRKKPQKSKMDSWLSPASVESERGFLGILLLSIFFLLVVQVLTYRALYNDGMDTVGRIILLRDFAFYETARQSMHVLYQWPLVLWTHLGWPLNMRSAAFLLSFGFYWIHIFSLLFCYWILPRQKKVLFLFPLCQWHFGVSAAIGLPVAEILGLISYFWTILFALCFAKLQSPWARLLIVMASLPLLFSHEYIGALGLVLSAVSIARSRKELGALANLLICLAIWFAACAVTGIYLTWNPASEAHREYFFNAFYKLQFLFPFGGVNHKSFLSVLCVIGVLLSVVLKSSKVINLVTTTFGILCAVYASFLFFTTFRQDAYLLVEFPYHGMGWAALSVPLMLVSFFLAKGYRPSKLWWVSLTFSGVAFTAAHSLGSIYFHKYLEQVQSQVLSCRGLIHPAGKLKLTFRPKAFRRYWNDQSWTLMYSSLLFAPEFKVKAILIADDSVISRLPSPGLQNRYFDFSEYFAAVSEGKSGCP